MELEFAMALDHRPMERAELRRRLLISLAVAAALVVVAFAASVVFGWTLPAGTDFTITTDPAGTLPF
jgi:multisubunit Na+/H+ antiporter MnhB subunit